MVIPTQALATFRRRAIDAQTERPLPAIFVLEPGMCVAAAVIASWHPVSSLQLLGATERAGAGAGRGTIEHAIDRLGAQTVVVCGEGTVRPDHGADRERLLGACLALVDEPVLGPVLRARAVTVEALWFDSSEGDIYLWDVGTRRFELLADQGLERFFANIFGRSSSSSWTGRA